MMKDFVSCQGMAAQEYFICISSGYNADTAQKANHHTGSAMNFLVTLKISKSCLSRFALRASMSTPS